MKTPKLVMFYCHHCKQELCKALPSALVACPVCNHWSVSTQPQQKEEKVKA